MSAERLTPDPRFGMLSPVVSSTTTLPTSGTTLTVARSRTITRDGATGLAATLVEGTTVAGKTSSSTYNAALQKWTTTTAAGRTSVVSVDGAGRPLLVQRNGLADTTFTWNQGRISTITRTGRPARQFFYTDGTDGDGYASKTIAPNGDITLFAHDARGRVTKQSRIGGNLTSLFTAASYDPSGELAYLAPPGHDGVTSRHRFSYEERGLLDTYTPPDVANTGSVTYSYNDDAQLTAIGLPGGTSVTHTWNPTTGQLESVTLPGGMGTITYGYEQARQQLASMAGPGNITTSIVHDGNLVKSLAWTGDFGDSVSAGVSFDYDASFRLAKEKVNDDNEMRWAYDNDGYPTWVGTCDYTAGTAGTGTGMALTWNDKSTTNPHSLSATIGSVTDGVFGNRVEDTWVKNAFGELDSYTATYKDSQTTKALYSELLNVSARDNLGRIVTRRDSLDGATTTTTYGYSQGRLSSVTVGTSATKQYRYDANGNRLNIGGEDDTAHDAVYDFQDRLTSYNGTDYAYTADGYLHTKTTGASVTTYNYDALGNLRSVALPANKTITYKVDGSGRRVSRSDGTTTHRYIYRSKLQPVAEVDANGAVLARYVYVTGRNVPDFMTRGAATYRIITDHLGSVRAVVDLANGAIVQKIDYDVWGKATLLAGSWDLHPFGFAGGLYDPDTGLVRFGARDYDPEVGRWTAKDPIRFRGGDTNLYGYVLSDPVNGVDYAGLRVFLCSDPAQLPFASFFGWRHYWLMTDSQERGMGLANGACCLGVDWQKHDGRHRDPAADCQQIPDVDESCVNSLLASGESLGNFTPWNTCEDAARNALNYCTRDLSALEGAGWPTWADAF